MDFTVVVYFAKDPQIEKDGSMDPIHFQFELIIVHFLQGNGCTSAADTFSRCAKNLRTIFCAQSLCFEGDMFLDETPCMESK